MKGKNNNGLRNIVLLGLVSCFADISSEMVYPIIPLYLTTVLGTTPVIVGTIEGIAESLASLLKVFSGYVSDKYHKKKKLAFFGYSTGLVYKLALLFATSWVGILIARIIDRFGKGIRTAPRDAMVAESADKTRLGKSFGIHKALDMLGSSIGILISFIILRFLGDNVNTYKTLFIISIIPILIALCFFNFIKEKEVKSENENNKKEKFWENIGSLDNNLKLYLIVVFIFTLGNSSNSFLLMRANNVGFSSTNVILLYFIYNIIASILAIPIGKKSDKKGRKGILVSGYMVFSIVYLLFGLTKSKAGMIMAFVLYGIYTAMIAGVEKSLITEIAPKNLKATMLGLHGTLVGIALLPASFIAGILWQQVNAAAPFIFGSIMSFIAAMILIFGLKIPKIKGESL